MAAAKRVLHYLKANLGEGSLMGYDFALQLATYCGADWGACSIIRCYLKGYFVTLGGSPISQKIKKQTTLPQS